MDPKTREDGLCPKCEATPNSCFLDLEIHYGIITSSNHVMKNEEQRDKLRKQLGACCVEIEVFGLMNNFPCLVIRGISNYANGRKNDK